MSSSAGCDVPPSRKQKVQVFKPAIDIRYAVEKVASHAGTDFDAIPVSSSAEIFAKLDADTTVAGVDEAQFFDEGIVSSRRADGGQRHPRDRGRAGL